MKPEQLCEQEQAILYDLQCYNVEEWHSPLIYRLERSKKYEAL